MALINANNLPAPRLELRWELQPYGPGKGTSICRYNLVLPLRECDIRRDVEGPTLTVELGRTVVGGPPGKNIDHENGDIKLPWRDGQHAEWDAAHLGNLPIYAICDGKAMLVKTTPPVAK